MQEEQYNDYIIRGDAYKDDDTNKWVARAIIVKGEQDSGREEEYPLTWEREFDTREEAENFAMQSAQFYIETHF